MKHILLILLLLFIEFFAIAQRKVEGIVTDQKTGARIELVNVGVLGSTRGTATDVKGYYQLTIKATTDSVMLRFSSTGYHPYERMVATKGDDIILNVEMRPSVQQLGPIEISDEKSRETSFTHIDVEKLEATVGPGNGVESLLKTLPDVNSNNELSSQYSVRGGSFDENLVYINGVEVFRPMLIRSGQQEGMSIINPNLVDFILFSPGGFEASYADKMSSVLDITYSHPIEFKCKVNVSLLGATASVQGIGWEKFSYAVALRQHSNSYLFRSLDTKGSYTTSYTDLQATASYKVSEKFTIGMLALLTRNVYGLVPESQTTAFGGIQKAMELDIYFDGAEEDKYRTLLGALTLDYHPDDDWHFYGNLSVQNINENERYDVQSQYWLYELGMGQNVGETERFDRGIGTFLEHARNRLNTGIYTLDMNAKRYVRLGQWRAGVRLQMNRVDDRLREWRYVDSAGYALPTNLPLPGDSLNMPVAPILQAYINSNGGLQTLKGSAYIQRDLNFVTGRNADLRIVAGLRGSLYNSLLNWYDDESKTGVKVMIGPRLSVSYKPKCEHDLLFRLAMGIYNQAPLYREYRNIDGTLDATIGPQTSYQVMGTTDWNLKIMDRPFKITADLFYKYVTDLIPYTVDNLRISYHPDEKAVAYATGISLRINGEFVEDLEAWASISLMKTQEDIEGDKFGWLDRPTDQRFSFKMFLQDYVPEMNWWRMSMSMIYATGMPVTAPYGRQDVALRLPSYLRVDWGNTVQLSKFEKLKNWKVFRYLDDIQLGVEVFNLFNFHNVISYLWVTDYKNMPFRVPNYLTARQVNFKLTVIF